MGLIEFADDAETAGPADLLSGREGQLQESDGLQLAGPAQVPGVDRVDSTCSDSRRQFNGFEMSTTVLPANCGP